MDSEVRAWFVPWAADNNPVFREEHDTQHCDPGCPTRDSGHSTSDQERGGTSHRHCRIPQNGSALPGLLSEDTGTRSLKGSPRPPG